MVTYTLNCETRLAINRESLSLKYRQSLNGARFGQRFLGKDSSRGLALEILDELLQEKRREEEQPERRRYEQAERHHREAKLIAWTAAVFSAVMALAAAVSAWFAWHPPQPPAGPAPTPPTVTSPSPTSHDQ
jgi:hypothetical protein